MLARATKDPWEDEEDPQELLLGTPEGSLVPGVEIRVRGSCKLRISAPIPKHSRVLAGVRLEENAAGPPLCSRTGAVALQTHLIGDLESFGVLKRVKH